MQASRANEDGQKLENEVLGASAEAKIQASKAKAMQKPIFSTVPLMRRQMGPQKQSLGTLPGTLKRKLRGQKIREYFFLAF